MGLVTRLGAGTALANELVSKQRGDATQLWDDRHLNSFLGEHGWRDPKDLKLAKNTYAGIRTPYAGIVESLTAEGNTEDNSVDESFTLHLPTSGAIRVLGLHLRSGKTPEYVDAGGVLRWQDPSLHTRGAGAGVVSRDYFLDRLARAGLEPVWVLAGEKNVYSGQDLGGENGFGGSLCHTTVFTVTSGALTLVGQKAVFRKPSAEQLKVLRTGCSGREP